jgi:hypothetical protein
MTAARRRIIRPARPRQAGADPDRQRHKLRQRLEREYQALRRWQKRLNRAFRAFAKHQRSVARLESQLRKQEDS